MSKVYDVFAEEYIDETEIDPIAPPERYREIGKETGMDTIVPTETYRLTLEHYMVANDGRKHLLEEPLVVQMIYDLSFGGLPHLTNQMLDMMKNAMLDKV